MDVKDELPGVSYYDKRIYRAMEAKSVPFSLFHRGIVANVCLYRSMREAVKTFCEFEKILKGLWR